MNRIATIIVLALCAAVPAGAQALDSLDAARHPAVSAEGLFEGRVSGVEVYSTSGSQVGALRTRIRGVNTLKGGAQPVWIVDGAVLNPVEAEVADPFWQYGDRFWSAPENSLLGLSVYDIESIEVLKDVSATAIYGSLGANGVVIVKTRPYAEGRGMGVRLNSSLDVLSLAHNHHVSVSGSREKNRYFLSGNWRQFGGQTAGGGMGGFRFNFEARTNSALTLGINSSASFGQYSLGNPLVEGDTDDDTGEYRTTDSFWMDFAVAQNLHVRADFGVDYRSKRRYTWLGTGNAFGEAMNGAAGVSSTFSVNANAALQAEYTRWIDKDRLTVIARGEFLAEDSNGSVMNGFDFFDYSMRAKGINISGAPAVLHRADYVWNRFGASVAASYDHQGLFGADAMLRADTAPVFDEGRMTFFPAVNAWADLGKMVLGEGGLVSSARLTAGWGRAGKDVYLPWLMIPSYTTSYPVAVNDQLQAFYKGLSRVISSEFNVGISAALLDNRYTAAVKYYSKVTDDAAVVFCDGEEFGENGFWRYVDQKEVFRRTGVVSNRGIEADLGASVLDGPVKIGANLTAAYNINRVEDISELDNAQDSFLGRWAYSDVAGWPADAIVGYNVENGAIVDVSGDGKITDADRVVLGSTQPLATFGLNLTASWQRLSFDALLTGAFGAKMIDFDKLTALDAAAGAKSGVLPECVVSADYVRPARATLTYDVPLGKFARLAGLKVNLTAASPLPVCYGPVAGSKGAVVAGICLTL